MKYSVGNCNGFQLFGTSEMLTGQNHYFRSSEGHSIDDVHVPTSSDTFILRSR